MRKEPVSSIAYGATEEVLAALDRIGRTEDTQFSPDGRSIALAGLEQDRLLIVNVATAAHPERWSRPIELAGAVELTSSALKDPHGLVWIDDRTLAVANRMGSVAIFEIPADRSRFRQLTVEPLCSFGNDIRDLVETPGSIAMRHVGLGLIELLVCNNYAHHISRHLIDRRDGCRLIASELFTDEDLDIPDGIACDRSGRWLGVSNHNHHCVHVYDYQAGKVRALLTGVDYPHGIRFSPDASAILVADAGAPFVHVFRETGSWDGQYRPQASLRILDDKTFRRGRSNPQEGGPKGIDISEDGALLAVSCEEQPLAFFDLKPFGLAAESGARPLEEADEAERVRETLLGYFSRARGLGRGAGSPRASASLRRSVHDAEKLREQIDRMVRSRSWRITAPLRRINRVLKSKSRNW